MRTGILFDLDGTLLNTLDDLMDATNYALKQYGCPERSLDQIRLAVGTGAWDLIAKSLPGTPNDPPVEQVLETYRAYYAENCQVKTGPYPGILEALEQIRQQFPVAIVSNKPDKAVKALCRDYFGDVYALGQIDGCPHKPAPDMLYMAMKHIGVDRCIYVGDSDVDVLTAKNANVPCISVLWGFRDQECIENAGGSCFCRDAGELLPTILKILAQ